MKTKVIFVCLGNICRSPAAEAVLKKIISNDDKKEAFIVDSAGTSGFHDGEPADSRMIDTGKKRGLSLTSISRKFTKDDFSKFDFIIVMDDSNLKNIQKLDTTNEYSHKLYKMTEYASGKFKDFIKVPDPYYGCQDGFDLVFDLLDNCCQNFYESIK